MEGSDAAKARALTAYGQYGNVSAACAAASISRGAWYRWQTEDAAFAERVAETRETVLDRLEAKVFERAERESDTLAIFLLKSHRRELYGDRTKIEVVSPDVQDRLRRQIVVIRSRSTWESEALLTALSDVWAA